MASNYNQGQGFPSNLKYPANSKTPIKNSFKMPSIHSTVIPPNQSQNASRVRYLSVGSEKKRYDSMFKKKISSIAEQNVGHQMNIFTKNGSSKKINYNIAGESDPKGNKISKLNHSVLEEENRRVVHLRPIENYSAKNDNSLLLNARIRGNSTDQPWIGDKSSIMGNNRIRKTHLPPIAANISLIEETNVSHISNSNHSRYQPSPLNKRTKADRLNTDINGKLIAKRFEPTPIKSMKKASSPSVENFYRLEIAYAANKEKVERKIIKKSSNLLSASFDQETSYEGSQKTDRSVQHDNNQKANYSHRHKRHKRKGSHKLALESLFDVNTNQSLDDAYEKLNRLTNRNSKAREALLKIQESVVEITAEDNYAKKVSNTKSKDESLTS